MNRLKYRRNHRHNTIWLRLLAIALGCWLVACAPIAETQVAIVRVQRVVSGQAIETVGTGAEAGRQEPVRLLGLDAPDLRQDPWGAAARDVLQSWVGDREVRLEFEDEPRDAQGRLRAYVWLPEASAGAGLVNERLIAEGYVLANTGQDWLKYDRRLRYAQERARILELGIWNLQQALRLSPSEFRRQ